MFLLLSVHLSMPRQLFFFFNDTATTEIYTLSLHDALPIFARHSLEPDPSRLHPRHRAEDSGTQRSEEHTSELQSHSDVVCSLLLVKNENDTSDDSGCPQDHGGHDINRLRPHHTANTSHQGA